MLRFIGDASLAVFPVDGASGDPERSGDAACARAVAAARAARENVAAANRRRRDAGAPEFGFGIGLHRGEVLYGNIGTPGRLEFTVIGPAANETARIEDLCKTTGEPVVASAPVALPALGPWRSLGRHPLRGVSREVEVYALPA